MTTKIKTKKRKKVTPYRKLFLKAERLWKELAFLRDGHRCQVAVNFPGDGLKHSDILQVDHFITRGDHNLFFHPQNGSVVCSNCNAAKKWKTGAVEEKIRKIVMDREGAEAVGKMLETHLSMQPNLNWKSAAWLEVVVIPQLEQCVSNLKRGYRMGEGAD